MENQNAVATPKFPEGARGKALRHNTGDEPDRRRAELQLKRSTLFTPHM